MDLNVDIKFIAAKAGVSPATVSRVLNHTKPVSGDLCAKVMEAVEKYHYRPNMAARSLILNKSNLIGVIAPNVSDVFHAKIILGIESCASEHDHNVIVSNIYTNDLKQLRSFKIMRERRVDGIILLHENTPEQMDTMMREIEVPLVLASVNVPGSSLPKVCIDDERAAYDAVSYLIRLGHRRIGGIFIENSHTLNVLRRNGYRMALEEKGLSPEECCTVATTFSMTHGEKAMERLLKSPCPPTAVFCVSDELAIGAATYLLDRGYRLPDDFSIMGFDDINLASVFRPKLCTIQQPIEEIGRMAAQMLITIMNGGKVPKNEIVFPHSLIVRDSCRQLT